MTEYLLALVPQYGVYLVSLVVFLGALGIPLPTSIIVLTSGGLAATGDLSLLPLFCATLGAFIIGDQLAFSIGKGAGPHWLEKLRTKRRIGAVVERSERLYNRHGLLAILMSRTVVSPTGPYIAYLSGIWGMARLRFGCVAAIGALIWTSAYLSLGFLFTGNIPEISDLVASILMVGVAAVLTLFFGLWLWVAWRRFEASDEASP